MIQSTRYSFPTETECSKFQPFRCDNFHPMLKPQCIDSIKFEGIHAANGTSINLNIQDPSRRAVAAFYCIIMNKSTWIVADEWSWAVVPYANPIYSAARIIWYGADAYYTTEYGWVTPNYILNITDRNTLMRMMINAIS